MRFYVCGERGWVCEGDEGKVSFHPWIPFPTALLIGLFFSFAIRYPYLNHLVLNAGTASFIAIDWLKLIVPFILHPVVTLTVVSYLIQGIGERSNDGLGYTWQCNVFGPYIFVSLFSHIPATRSS